MTATLRQARYACQRAQEARDLADKTDRERRMLPRRNFLARRRLSHLYLLQSVNASKWHEEAAGLVWKAELEGRVLRLEGRKAEARP